MALEPIALTHVPLTIPGNGEIAQRIFNIIECMDVRHMFFLRFGAVAGLEGWCPRVTIVASMSGQHDYCAVFIDATFECDSTAEKAEFHQDKYWQNWTSNTAFSRRDEIIFRERFGELVRLRFTNAMMRPERWLLVNLGHCDQINVYDYDNLPPLEDVEPSAVVEEKP